MKPKTIRHYRTRGRPKPKLHGCEVYASRQEADDVANWHREGKARRDRFSVRVFPRSIRVDCLDIEVFVVTIRDREPQAVPAEKRPQNGASERSPT